MTDEELKCPRCGGKIEGGYGIAMGPGLGTYWYCVGNNDDDCGWYTKTPDPEDVVLRWTPGKGEESGP